MNAALGPAACLIIAGMSNVEQMKDNLSYMKNFKPLDEKEREA